MSAIFGPAGNAESFPYKSSADAPRWLAELGLDCYEYQCGVHSKNSYLKEFKSFVDKVENTDFETEADWNEALKEYERFTTTYYEEYKDKLTEEDLVEIGRLQGRFMKASMTRGAKFIEKNFNDAIQQASGLLDGLFEENEDEE